MDAYDVAVIGAGGIGSSAANHLAAAGFATLLLDKGDVAGATSGRTSRLQYCGLSYFWNFRSILRALQQPGRSLESLELARRAMRDRSRFVRETPERLRPVTFYFPLHRDGGMPVWKVRAGFRVLEMLDPGGVPLDLTGVLLMAASSSRFTRERNVLTGGSVVVIWALVSRFALLVLTSRAIGLKDAPALTAAWIAPSVIRTPWCAS